MFYFGFMCVRWGKSELLSGDRGLEVVKVFDCKCICEVLRRITRGLYLERV